MASSWFPFFGRDFLAATTGWTADERGHYVTLLIVQWEQGGLPDDVKRLELISPGIRSCWKAIQDKFPVWKDGKRRNLRLEHERSKSHERSEKARQSASQRWASDSQPENAPNPPAPAVDSGEQCERICDRICEGTCDGTCSSDASMSMSSSPPPPAPHGVEKRGWPELRKAWNEGASQGRRTAWQSSSPPGEALDRLGDAGWLDEALRAIPMLAACKRFDDPVTLGQFCKPDFVAKVLGGYWRDKSRKPVPRAGPDDKPPPKVDPAFAAAAAATREREERRRAEEHARLDEAVGETEIEDARRLVRAKIRQGATP